MSLIEKALRRIQDPMLPPPDPAVQAPAPSESRKAHPAHSWPAEGRSAGSLPTLRRRRRTPTLLLTGFLIFLGLLWTGRMLQTDRAPSSAGRGTGLAPTPSAVPRLTPASPGASRQGLVLSGVVAGVGQPYAMINGLIIGLGESIGEWTFVEVLDGGVKLRHMNGKETSLYVSRR